MHFLIAYAKNRLRSFKYASHGLILFVRGESPALLHLIVILVTLIAGWWFAISPIEWMILTLTVAALLATELLNSAIEWLANTVTMEHHPMIGKTKDLAAGAVLIMSIAALIVASIIFVPKIMEQIGEDTPTPTAPHREH